MLFCATYSNYLKDRDVVPLGYIIEHFFLQRGVTNIKSHTDTYIIYTSQLTRNITIMDINILNVSISHGHFFGGFAI